eukprot:CAMPEP_0194210358 /NCGR_PEP_ID=MMETSP0156-20130528/8174_1 /TAXON_ID=33649 /ORGANISM="Thalassionema nitzschioides, Strain L26-B" /LENGTH=400 /DNA_ID=CAMNT_0038937689 /DNA_START=48 /DNA_END=1250 /DNA_ORIENTATION=-
MSSLLPFRKTESPKRKNSTKEALVVGGFLLFLTLTISSFPNYKRLPLNAPKVQKKVELSNLPPGKLRQLLDIEKKKEPALYHNLMQWDFHAKGTPHIGYVHIGKCGGVSVERAIQKTENGRNAIITEGVASYHMLPPPADYVSLLNDWMFAIRDPITRIQSNWIYAHPLNNPYRMDKTQLQGFITQMHNCYPSLDDAATKGLSSPSTSHTGEGYCPELLRRIFMGELKHGPQVIHYGRGFRYHISPFLKKNDDGTSVIEGKNIYVVRQENMEKDLNSINAAFGGSPTSFTEKIGNYPHFWDYKTNTAKSVDSLPYTDRTLSPEGMSNLCWILCDEIQVYKQVLQQAKNLERDQLEDSMKKLAQHCPKEAAEDYRCPMFLNKDWIKQGVPTADSTVVAKVE